jgi:hypothetical protein
VSDTAAVAAPDAGGAGAGLALQHGESLSAKSLVTHVEAAQDLPVSATTVEGQARASASHSAADVHAVASKVTQSPPAGSVPDVVALHTGGAEQSAGVNVQVPAVTDGLETPVVPATQVDSVQVPPVISWVQVAATAMALVHMVVPEPTVPELVASMIGVPSQVVSGASHLEFSVAEPVVQR